MHHLDTSVIVRFFRGDPAVTKRLAELGSSLAIPAPVLAELYYGALGSDRPGVRVQEVEDLLTEVPLVEFDADAARAYGKIRLQLRTAGRPIGEMDTLIAGVAMSCQATLATCNIKHFGRIEGLSVEDRSESGTP